MNRRPGFRSTSRDRLVPCVEPLDRIILLSLYVDADINIIDVPPQISSAMETPISTHAQGTVGSATASASDFALSSEASGGEGLSYPSGGTAQGSWSFTIQGGPSGVLVPLTFSYQVAISGNATSDAKGSGLSIQDASFDVYTAGAENKGTSETESSGGAIVYEYISNAAASSGTIETTVSGSGYLVASVYTSAASTTQGASADSSATFQLTSVSSPVAKQYPDMSVRLEYGQTMHVAPYVPQPLKEDGPSSDTPGSVQAGDPINIGTGNVYRSVEDYSTAGSNSLDFTRYYNTYNDADTAATTLGERWRSTYDRYLHIDSPTAITAERQTGQILNFQLVNGVWMSDSDMDYALTQSGSTWKLTGPDDAVETYNVNAAGLGTLSTIRARDGYTQTMTQNASHQLAQVSDSFGRTLSFTYQNGLLQTVTAPDHLVLTYTYGAVSDMAGSVLTSAIYPTSPRTSESYDYYPTGLLMDVIDQDGKTSASFTYDKYDRATEVYTGGNASIDRVTVSYVDTDGSRIVTDVNGLTTLYKFAMLQGVPKVTQMEREPSTGAPTASDFAYDAAGYVASSTDWDGIITQFVNDAHGQPTKITEAAGTLLARITAITYLPTYRLPLRIVAPGLTTDYGYDATGDLLKLTQTDTTATTIPYSTKGQQHAWTYSYGKFGEILTADGPRTDVNDKTTYTYTAIGYPSTVTDALGHVTKINSYSLRGLPLSETDANGVTTLLAYNPMGWLISSTVLTAAGNAVTRYGYDAAGNLISLTQPDNSELFYHYDTSNRLVGVSDPAGESITYTLDGAGNVIRQDIKNAGGSIVETQSQVFNALGELVQSIGAAPTETTSFGHDADGNVTSTTDAANHTTTQAFDALNRLIRTADPLNGVTQDCYDAQGNLASVTDPRGLKTSYVFNGFGQVIEASSPDTGITVYRLDPAGNVISETDARGVVTNFTYDALNRVTSETYPASPGQNVTYRYDATAGGNKGIGRLTSYTDPSGQTMLAYDALGDVTASTQIIGKQVSTTSETYDLAGKVTQITYPSGRLVNFTYDSQGRISGVTTRANSYAPGVTLASGVTYEPFGPLATLTYGNGLTLKRTYDADYRITGIVTQGGGVTVQNESLAYDAKGNVVSITDHLTPADSQVFTYDALNRLLTASGTYPTVAYTYDADSNRKTVTQGGMTQTYNYAANSNRLLSVTGGSTRNFSYTADGNIATDSGSAATYTYSAADRLAQVAIGGVTSRYFYDAFGERASKTVAGVATQFHYDQAGHLIAESNGATGATTRQYVWLGDLPLAQIESSGAIYFIHADQTNTPQKMTDAGKAVVWSIDQQPFGQTVSTTGTTSTNLRAAGQYADAESGLNYNMNRDYDPSLGRYTEADPIGLAGGVNLYGYVNQNPVDSVDPLGLCDEPTSIQIAADDEKDPTYWRDYIKRRNEEGGGGGGSGRGIGPGLPGRPGPFPMPGPLPDENS